MRTYVTLTAIAVAATAAYLAPNASTGTTNVAARGSVKPSVPDRALLDADPVIPVDTGLDLMVEYDPIVIDEPAHDHSTHSHEGSAPATTSRATPRRLTYGRWRTPEAAMRHLVRAYNAKDAEALKDVTTPQARFMLNEMRSWAPDLRLVSCTDTKAGSFDCSFTHAYAKAKGRGTAVLRVNPARKQGWYATIVVDCG
jgi:hypothetical protein